MNEPLSPLLCKLIEAYEQSEKTFLQYIFLRKKGEHKQALFLLKQVHEPIQQKIANIEKQIIYKTRKYEYESIQNGTQLLADRN